MCAIALFLISSSLVSPFFELIVECGVDLWGALMPWRIRCCSHRLNVSVYLVVFIDVFPETLLLFFEVSVVPGALEDLFRRMVFDRCYLLCVFEREVQSSQIQRHLSTVHLDCSVRCSSHCSTADPERLHLNYVQFLQDVVCSLYAMEP